MLRSTAVALTILVGCDYVIYGGQYLINMLHVLAAIEHAIV
jgi:hypothetical protein